MRTEQQDKKPEISQAKVDLAIAVLKSTGRRVNARAFYDAAKVVAAAKPFTDQNLTAAVLREIGAAWAIGQLSVAVRSPVSPKGKG